ncbi:MAG: hypothetical protein WCK03_00775 [Candidatus Taylorbacteria bacterium]
MKLTKISVVIVWFFISGILATYITALAGMTNFVQAQALQCITPAEKVKCQADLLEAEADAKAAQAQLTDAQAQSSSLKQAINVLDAKIKVAQANIKAKNLLVQTLGYDISQKQSRINDLESHISKGKQTLAQILVKTNELDSVSLAELLLSQNTVTGFFQNLDTFQSIREGLSTTVDDLRSDQASTTAEKEALTTRQNTEMDARYAIQQEQKNIQIDQSQKTRLLTISKGNEKSYSSLLAQEQAKALEIRTALFQLRDTAAITFEQALRYATAASQKTGVRPAFILAILTKESDLGLNVGKCLVTNLNTGDGKGKDSGKFFEKVMKSPRDTDPFKAITSALGVDWSTRTVSCPIGSATYYSGRGYGGAMGPAQFIPSTWELIKDTASSNLGLSTELDPWNPAHAIMALAVFVKDLGAGAGTYSSEIRAACRYYGGGGSTCVYGKNVMTLVDSIQRNKIDLLQGL